MAGGDYRLEGWLSLWPVHHRALLDLEAADLLDLFLREHGTQPVPRLVRQVIAFEADALRLNFAADRKG